MILWESRAHPTQYLYLLNHQLLHMNGVIGWIEFGKEWEREDHREIWTNDLHIGIVLSFIVWSTIARGHRSLLHIGHIDGGMVPRQGKRKPSCDLGAIVGGNITIRIHGGNDAPRQELHRQLGASNSHCVGTATRPWVKGVRTTWWATLRYT